MSLYRVAHLFFHKKTFHWVKFTGFPVALMTEVYIAAVGLELSSTPFLKRDRIFYISIPAKAFNNYFKSDIVINQSIRLHLIKMFHRIFRISRTKQPLDQSVIGEHVRF